MLPPRRLAARVGLAKGMLSVWAAQPRERATKAERGAGSAAAVPRSGAALDPSSGAVPFVKYAADWMGQGQFTPKTAQLYELLLRLHLLPTFGEMSVGDIREENVRSWRAAELKTGPLQDCPFGPVTVAKSYRLLPAILNTAVRDKRMRENPCQIKGAEKEFSPERPPCPRSTAWLTRSSRATAR